MITLIKNARLISHSNRGVKDVLVIGGRIEKIAEKIEDVKADKVINAKSKVLIPGLIDMHVHLREPGFEHRETLKTGLKAALHGGVTTLATMPNTSPAIDSPALIYYLKNKARELGYPNLEVVGAITKGREGKQLSEMGSLADEGAIAFSDDGNPVESTNLMLKALEYSKLTKRPIIDHCEVTELSNKGYMREGKYSSYYGIYGIPSVAESIMVARDVELADYAKSRIHIAHVSCANSIEIIRNARKRGVEVSCEITHNHLLFCDKDLKDYSTNLKVNPPLPAENEMDALINGIKDKTIDIIVSDHAPYAKNEKEMEFQTAPYGISGLETLLSGIVMISEKYGIEIEDLMDLVTYNPARLFGIDKKGDIKEGYNADLVIVDLNKKWKVDETTLLSKGKNTPFFGMDIPGVVELTMVNGEVKYTNGDLNA